MTDADVRYGSGANETAGDNARLREYNESECSLDIATVARVGCCEKGVAESAVKSVFCCSGFLGC